MYGTVHIFHLHFSSSFLRTLPITSTQWCAIQPGLLALTLFDAALLAFVGDQLLADFGCLGKCCPERFIHVAGFVPTPVSRWWQSWCKNQGLTPDMSTLVYCSSDVLLQAVELEELGNGQCSWCGAFTLMLDTGTFQDHTDQGKQHG